MAKERVKAFGYARVSSRGQVDGYGFDRQEEVINAYADSAGYEVVHIYREEAVSGTAGEADRPAFKDMVSEILRDGVRTVIVEGLDRLAREYRIQETLLIYLASKGVTLISARTQENVTEAVEADPMRKALVQIQGIFAELEKSLLVKKLRDARRTAKAERGKCEGRKNYLEATPEMVEEVRRLRRKPKGGKRLTYAEIAEALNQRGMRNMTGGPFSGQVVYKMLAAVSKKKGGMGHDGA
jgi:DNA invertase Pin-like site-specific DNA recombinase